MDVQLRKEPKAISFTSSIEEGLGSNSVWYDKTEILIRCLLSKLSVVIAPSLSTFIEGNTAFVTAAGLEWSWEALSISRCEIVAHSEGDGNPCEGNCCLG